MDEYHKWADVPQSLKTKTQLGRAGMKPAANQQPTAVFIGKYGDYDLYDIRQAVAKRQLSKAQQTAAAANIKKAREAQLTKRTCKLCRFVVSHKRKLHRGICDDCHHQLWLDSEKEAALARFQELATQTDWVVVDTETTGLGDYAQVVQIAIVAADGTALVDQLVRPSVSIEPGAMGVHGLTLEKLADAPAWPDVYPCIIEAIGPRRILAYNAPFDQRMIAQTCAAYGLPQLANDWECIMELFARWWGDWSTYYEDFKWQSLGRAYAIMGSDSEALAAHTAVGDAEMTRQLIMAMEAG